MSSLEAQDWMLEQRAYWDRIAPMYDSLYKGSWSRLEDSQLRGDLSPLMRAGQIEVLDVGCGTGLGYQLCKELNPHVQYTGLDVSPEMVNVFSRRWPGVRVVIGSLSSAKETLGGAYNVIIAVHAAMSYCDSLSDQLSDIHEMLAPGGRVGLSILSRRSLRRLLSSQTGQVERFGTRGDRWSPSYPPAWALSSRELQHVAAAAGFVNITIGGRSLLGGVAEIKPLWRVSRGLSVVAADLCHTLWLVAEKSSALTSGVSVGCDKDVQS